MANTPFPKSSFSIWQRWSIFFSVLVSVAAMSAVMIMLNYLGARYYLRFPWSAQTGQQLSSQTISVLNSVTNDINVVVFYNKKDRLYGDIKDLLEEYHLHNSKISMRTVDYLVDAAEAAKIKEAFADVMGPGIDTNLVIFSSANATNVIPGEKLGRFEIEAGAGEDGREYRNKLAYFEGEENFTAAIFHLINYKPQRAYFLQDVNSVHHLDGQDLYGYQTFKTVMQMNNVDVTNIANLPGTNGVPADCKLLIIAGPSVLTHAEIVNIRRYLDEGGHLFVLFNNLSREINTGLEAVLAEWGVTVGRSTVRDLENYYDESGRDVVVNSFSRTQPIVSHLTGLSLQLMLPRSIGTNSSNPGTEPSGAQEIAWTGKKAVLGDSPVITGKPIPLIVAVEKGEVKGITDRGPTRIVVVGDSYFLDNGSIAGGRNRAFASYAVNWLLGQSLMLQGVGPHRVLEYKLKMTPEETENIRWIFLAGMPGAILFLGGLVWLRRRR